MANFIALFRNLCYLQNDDSKLPNNTAVLSSKLTSHSQYKVYLQSLFICKFTSIEVPFRKQTSPERIKGISTYVLYDDRGS